jgi:glutamate-1-semialdehyde 2,1-aminomutase
LTGKQKVAKFDGHFHGHAHDSLSVSSIVPSGFDGTHLVPVPDWAGIPSAAVENVLILPFDDASAAVKMLEESADSLAALILEPVPFSSLGGIPAEVTLLETIREATRELGIVLIYDEVITAFRLELGGAGTYFGVEPDLVALGKIIGGGLPLGSYGGREEIMERVVTPTRRPSDSTRKIFQSGTFSANPMSLAAGIAMLDELERLDYGELGARTARLRDGLRRICERLRLPAQVTGVESLFHIHFTEREIRSHRDAQTTNQEMNRELCFGLMASGVFWPLLHGGFLSSSHSEPDVDRILEVAADVLTRMAEVRAAETISV